MSDLGAVNRDPDDLIGEVVPGDGDDLADDPEVPVLEPRHEVPAEVDVADWLDSAVEPDVEGDAER